MISGNIESKLSLEVPVQSSCATLGELQSSHA